MTTKVKTHKRKGKNKVSVIKEHTRKSGKHSACSRKKGCCGKELEKVKSTQKEA